MFRNKSWVISIVFIALDIILLYGSFRLAIVLRAILSPWLHQPPVTWEATLAVAQLGILLTISMFFLQRLYPGYGLTAIKELEQMGKAITLAFILLAMISYLNKPFQAFPRSIFPIAWLLVSVALPLARFLARNLLSRTTWYGIPVIVFGEGDWGAEVMAAIERVRRIGWRPVALHPPGDFDPQHFYQDASLVVLASTSGIALAELVRALNQKFRKVVLLRNVDNFGSLWVETRDLDGYLALEFNYHLLSKRNRWVKRMLDIFIAVILLVVLSPLLVLVSLLIVLDSPGPVLFWQERLGRDFLHFRVLKFRTMVVGAEERLQQLLEADPVARAQYERFHKLENDPRVTKVGNYLRKYSLDELPQLLNVLKGEMSPVGPRAYLPSELDEIGSYAPIILRVRPGMTGWWQIFGRHKTTFKHRLQMDEYYISNWSLWMDIYILLKTVGVVLGGEGA